MRVVAGALRGRRLETPPGTTTRPTTDRVREATFNALDSAGVVGGARVADLFAGSGALGIEALSRGAAHCTFVEHDRAAVVALRANLARLELEQNATVVAGDVMSRASRLGALDLVLADPPYDFASWAQLLSMLRAHTVVVESGAPLAGPALDQWLVGRTRRYGRTWVTFLHATVRDDVVP